MIIMITIALFHNAKLLLKVCATVPVPQIRQAKETECQRCRKYSVPTPTTKWAIECNPVYDEKCKTRLEVLKIIFFSYYE